MFLKKYATLGLLFLCSLVILKPLYAQNESTNNSAIVKDTKRNFETAKEKLVKIQRFLNIYSTIGRFSGVAVITQNGNYIHRFTTNYATLDYKVRCSLATQFNTCDITELFTTTAIMQLLDEGKIDLQDKIGQYLLELPADKGAITIHQLLTHTSGLINYYDLVDEYRRGFYDVENMNMLIDITTKYPLEFAPGSQYKKSPSAYVYLAALVSKISGMAYKTYIEEKILKPNEMEASGVYSWFDPAEQKAVGYFRNENNEPKEAPEYWGAHAFGADGVYCSIEDLAKFNNAFQKGDLFSDAAQKLMLTPHLTNPDNLQEKIGYGWHLKESNGFKIMYQGGQLGGIGTDMRYYVKEGYGVIIYSNYGVNIASDVGDKIEEILTTHTSTVANYAVSFVLEEVIEQKGIGYVAENFETILSENNIKLYDPWPLYFLGKDYISKNQPNVAVKLYHLSLEQFPKEPMLYDALGECYYKVLGDCQNAKKAFESKLALQPTDSRSKRMLETFEAMNCSGLPKSNQNLVSDNSSINDKPFVIQTQITPKTQAETSSNSMATSVEEEEELQLNERPSKEPQDEGSLQKTRDLPTTTESKSNIPSTEKITPKETEESYTIVEEMPQFPDGQKALHQYIYQNLRYPASAYVNDIEGTVYIEFSIDTYGNVVNAKVDNPIEENDGGLALEALRLINSMPRWSPGVHEGKEVIVKMKVPIRFSKKQFLDSDNPDR